jgi:hypothetical protein
MKNYKRYSKEQKQWFRDCVFPGSWSTKNLQKINTLAEQFNAQFKTNISAKALYGQLALIKGSWNKRGQKRKSKFTAEQRQWMREVDLSACKTSEQKVQLAQKFNKAFHRCVRVRGFYAYVAKLQRRSSVVHSVIQSATPTPVCEPQHPKVSALSGLPEIMPPVVKKGGKFMVLIDNEVVWSGEEQPKVDTGPVYVVVVNGQIIRMGVNKFNLTVVKALE